MIIMLVMTDYVKNYAIKQPSTIYQSLLTLYLFFLDLEGSLRFLHFFWRGGGGGGGGGGVGVVVENEDPDQIH